MMGKSGPIESGDYIPEHAAKDFEDDFIQIGVEGEINEVQVRDGWVTVTARVPPESLMHDLRSWHGILWAEKTPKPDPEVLIGEHRRNPDTTSVWIVVGQSENWVWCRQRGLSLSDRPESFMLSQVQSWPLVTPN